MTRENRMRVSPKAVAVLGGPFLWALLLAGASVMSGCADEAQPDDPPVLVDPSEGSSSSSGGGESSSGDTDETGSSSGELLDEGSSSSGDECLEVEAQVEPYGHCGSYCEGECSDGRRCVNDSVDSEAPFDLATCSRECTASDQCDILEGAADPICQVGQCFIPCDAAPCPSGFECFQPNFLDAVPVCLAVGA